MDVDSKIKRQRTQVTQEKSFLRLDHLGEQAWYQRINFLNCFFVFGLPAIAIYGLLTTKIVWQTVAWTFAYYVYTCLGITTGYHRFYAHRAYKLHPLMEMWVLFGASGALQGSAKWWSLLHRAHHRYTDTDDDPYNIQRGFWYAHVGWLIFDSIEVGRDVEMADLKANPFVRWQHKFYVPLGLFAATVFPGIVAKLLWDDFRGGFFLAGVLRCVCLHHGTWCVNSVAHWYGDFTFDDTISPRDSIITGFLTLGEGYHNFHHEFPNDYRNGIHWYDYDPSKWTINLAARLGLAYDLVRFDDNTIQRGKLDMQQKRLDEAKKSVDYGVDVATLPQWTRARVDAECAKGRACVIAHGIVLDLTDFLARGMHPGGKRIVLERVGRDVTDDFSGGVYNHTNAARNLASHMRVAVFDGGHESHETLE